MKKLEIKEYNTPLKKLKGLMFKKDFNYAVRLRSNGIHTFFMKKPIDVILTDKNKNIIKIYRNVLPNKIILPKKGVYYTYELPINTIKNIKEKNKLDI